ncbi:MAG: PA2778 family cysteine peptidase [Rhodospirillales bacterium]|jgi:tetratricopeptide (TPR) repeat protein|nr:PA2778 family cysteine peptidase [Rhodospirillales bacterium]
MSRFRRFLAAVTLAVAVAGCAAPQTAKLLENRASLRLPAQALVDGVPLIPQEDRYCGPATLAMALAAAGVPADQSAVAEAIYTPGREGTLRGDVLAGARRWGRMAVPVNRMSDLLAEIAAGNPVIVFQNLSLDIAPQWHFALAVGYDLDHRQIILNSGTVERLRTSLSTFEHTWARGDHWSLVVTAPDRLPVSADEPEAMAGAAGLERAGRLAEASLAWRAVIGRWPDSFGAHMGLGNTRYARHDYAGARSAFMRAAEIRPGSADAWNNLAYALARLGDRRAAIAAAQKAVSLGGDNPIYQDTLDEIRGGAAI